MKKDPTEMIDLSAKYPEKVKELNDKFKAVPFMKKSKQSKED
jgi:hypothetical protein